MGTGAPQVREITIYQRPKGGADDTENLPDRCNMFSQKQANYLALVILMISRETPFDRISCPHESVEIPMAMRFVRRDDRVRNQ